RENTVYGELGNDHINRNQKWISLKRELAIFRRENLPRRWRFSTGYWLSIPAISKVFFIVGEYFPAWDQSKKPWRILTSSSSWNPTMRTSSVTGRWFCIYPKETRKPWPNWIAPWTWIQITLTGIPAGPS